MNELQIIEYHNTRVVTTKQIAEIYGATPKKVSNNFSAHKSRYTEGKHYFVLQGKELKDFKDLSRNSGQVNNIPKLYLWTERGALLLAKSINTDIAWEAYERLVDFYFTVKDNPPQTTSLSTAVEPPKVPLKISWYQDNIEDIRTLAKRHEVSEKRVLHRVLAYLDDRYNLSAANAIYEREMGCPPDYATDIIAYFPELKEMADEWLDDELMRSVGMDW